MTALALTFLAVQGKAYESMAQLAMFLVTAMVSGLVAFVFASRTESQRKALETLATLDSLTGVPNRRAMEQELQMAVAEHRRDGTAFGLAMLDLDHFKSINDEHGHEAGDEVLIAFAELLRCATRKVDRCFRFGGEEFVLLMPATDSEGLRAIDASLRSRVAAELDCRGKAVTVSIGAASLRPHEDWQAWMSRADAALYTAKRQGRNRTVVDAGGGLNETDCRDPRGQSGHGGVRAFVRWPIRDRHCAGQATACPVPAGACRARLHGSCRCLPRPTCPTRSSSRTPRWSWTNSR